MSRAAKPSERVKADALELYDLVRAGGRRQALAIEIMDGVDVVGVVVVVVDREKALLQANALPDWVKRIVADVGVPR
jgi:hypothetical protein